MDYKLVFIGALFIIGPAILFVIKLCLFTVAAAVVASAISPTVVVKGDKEHGDQ